MFIRFLCPCAIDITPEEEFEFVELTNQYQVLKLELFTFIVIIIYIYFTNLYEISEIVLPTDVSTLVNNVKLQYSL